MNAVAKKYTFVKILATNVRIHLHFYTYFFKLMGSSAKTTVYTEKIVQVVFSQSEYS